MKTESLFNNRGAHAPHNINEMERKKKMIKAKPAVVKQLKDEFKCTEVSIRHALRYMRRSIQQQQIRKRAMELGADYYEAKEPTAEDLYDV